jgi:hypothetical protein
MRPMDPTNIFTRLSNQIAEVRRELSELRAAVGTLGSATIDKGGLTIKDPDTNSRLELGRAAVLFWGDYLANPTRPGRFGADPGSGANLVRLIPPYSDGSGENYFVIQGRRPGLVGAGWLVTDGTLILTGGQRVYIGGNGPVEISSNGLRLYGIPTTGAAANMRLETAGGIPVVYYVASSRRYKEDIDDAVIDSNEVLQVQPRTWVDKGAIDRLGEEGDEVDIPRNVGFIAEELDALPSMRQFVDYDDKGRPDAIQYDRLTVALLELAKAQQKQLDDQQTQITQMADRLDALERQDT